MLFNKKEQRYEHKTEYIVTEIGYGTTSDDVMKHQDKVNEFMAFLNETSIINNPVVNVSNVVLDDENGTLCTCIHYMECVEE